MLDLNQGLQGRDLGFLRIVADFWGIEFDAPDAKIGLQRLVPKLLDRELVEDVIADLPKAARDALNYLIENEGRISWSIFNRRYGLVREMGPARRDRERPYENVNASASEVLWYRALIGRAFFETPAGMEEFVYIPEDLLELMPPPESKRKLTLGRPASYSEKAFQIPADDRILDDTSTMLAALRIGLHTEEAERFLLSNSQPKPYLLTSAILRNLLESAGLIDVNGMPLPEPTRLFLESSRAEALAFLMDVWLRSGIFNELCLLPGISLEGEWKNDPIRARHSILDFLAIVPGSLPAMDSESERHFWSQAAFTDAIRQAYPDFQRPAGDYDSWYVRDLSSGKYLRGFEHWDEVDGSLIRFIIGGPLHWLGVLDLGFSASPQEVHTPVTSFAYSKWAIDLLDHKVPQGLSEEKDNVLVGSDGRIRMSTGVPRAVRYQISRFCDWQGISEDVFQCRLTPASLERARVQGLRTPQLVTLLRRYARNLPPNLVKALENWEAHGVQARLEQMDVLRLKDPETLNILRGSQAARYLGDPLGPTAVIIKPGTREKVLAILAEMGLLGEAK